ncbi:MAG: glycosyltransferase family 2 protein [Chthoniobacter sp.]|uniref:glycosyltransferase family 2 protein n=1 Tax=Chthoniobacter sp. TaxID=2510640 RepID=UPI0032A6470C
MSASPFISIVLPVFNEERYIERCLASVLSSGYPDERFEILVADGCSTDRTAEIVRAMAVDHPQIRLIENPRRLQSAGTNTAARAATAQAEFLVRLDAHSRYPEGFIPRCIQTAIETRAELVVFVNEPHGMTPFQEAVAFAFAHPLGVGDSLYRLGKFSGYVDHGQHGCFRREFYDRVGGYDEGMSHNEDSELSYRILSAGGRIYLDRELRMHYFPRAGFRPLAQQYFKYGKGRAANFYKHRGSLRPRQLAPPALVALEVVALTLSPWAPVLLLLPLCYFGLLVAAAFAALLMKRRPALLLIAPVFWLMHHAWGVGFIWGLMQKLLRGGRA